MTQFDDHAADAWFVRNRDKLGERDPVSDRLDANAIAPTRVLEVGCANGWRLKKLKEAYGCEIAGIDPSHQAVTASANGNIKRGRAHRLPFVYGTFDLVIYGFCLYLTNPADWFAIAAEGDRVLADGGHIIIHDFADYTTPHAVPYEHAEGVLSYHVNFAGLWLMHPWYRLVDWSRWDNEVVAILRKDPHSIRVWK